MEVIELKNVQLKEGHIFYFRKYTAIAILKIPTTTTEEQIEFSIETGPLGNKNIEVVLKSTPNYPIIPIVQGLKKFIIKNDTEGLLPT